MKRIIALVILVAVVCSLTSCISVSIGDLLNNGVDAGKSTVNLSELTDAVMNAQRSAVRIISRFVSFSGVASSQGSGIIFLESEKYYYLLTNYHVLVDDTGSTADSYRILDAYGDEHSAIIIAFSAELDLGVLRFYKSAGIKELTPVPLAAENAGKGEVVFAIGTPEGLINAVTYGKTLETEDIGKDDLDIAVLAHTCFVDHGSSGGGLFNSDGELVGINYAYGENTETGTRYSFSVPIEAVIEFLTAKSLLPETA